MKPINAKNNAYKSAPKTRKAQGKVSTVPYSKFYAPLLSPSNTHKNPKRAAK